MTKNPSAIWYFNDWENDANLKSCSLPAQAIWMRFLCVMARSPEPGVLMIGAFPASRQDITPRVAAHIGQPLDVTNAAIEELLTSGTASLDRKKRIINRRMVRAAGLSQKRSDAGKLGAEATHGKERRFDRLPSKPASNGIGKPPSSSSLPAPSSPSHGDISTDAPRASASPDGPPRTGLTDDETWRKRLDGYKPWLGEHKWTGKWGAAPDSAATFKLIPPHMLQWWQAQAAQARIGADA